MLRSYSDIRDRLGEPLWFDDNGAPRYDPFNPRMCGVYDRYVCLQEIACQYCGKRFQVASTWSNRDEMWNYLLNHQAHEPVQLAEGVTLPVRNTYKEGPTFPVKGRSGSFHYGDPPIHACIGDTMNVECVRIIEFWKIDVLLTPSEQRMPEYEVYVGEQER